MEARNKVPLCRGTDSFEHVREKEDANERCAEQGGGEGRVLDAVVQTTDALLRHQLRFPLQERRSPLLQQ